jgi:hypothetical protein
MKVQETLLKPERSRGDSMRVSHQLSRRYPGYSIDQALREENSKLRKELDYMRVREKKIFFPMTLQQPSLHQIFHDHPSNTYVTSKCITSYMMHLNY